MGQTVFDTDLIETNPGPFLSHADHAIYELLREVFLDEVKQNIIPRHVGFLERLEHA
ncbi:MAG: hypothetical protein JRN35_10335 [Nitrososphaerota archaeon]|nr:hypothetical protein [Nitrososphaerota archaeon]